MTAAPEAPTGTDRYTHPEWCDLLTCEPFDRPGDHRQPFGLHYSTSTTWGVQSDEAEVSVKLVRGDDYLHGHNHATTRIHLELANYASESVQGDEVFADAEMEASDARMLATILLRYAEMAERSDRPPRMDLDAADLPRRRAR